MTLPTDFTQRNKSNPICDILFKERWSPRSFIKQEMDKEHLSKIMDAARFAPSCYNEQPWRFLLSTQKTFDHFLDHLVEINQSWCKNASVIGFAIAKKHFKRNGQLNNWAQFDCGNAWMSLCLQAELLGYSTHGLGGIYKDKIYESFKIDPEKYEVICGFVIGVRADKRHLPDNFAEREEPSRRNDPEEIFQFDSFSFDNT